MWELGNHELVSLLVIKNALDLDKLLMVKVHTSISCTSNLVTVSVSSLMSFAMPIE